MTEFTHLHVHTQYSLLDGTAQIETLLDRAKEKGFKSLAITDHGVMYGVVDFYAEAIKRGIKPIIGCEVYTAPSSRFLHTQTADSPYGHLVLLCKDNVGYKNLMTLVSYAFTEGYYYKPRVDMELLKKYSDGLIALSGCLKGDVSACLVSGNYSGAVKKATEYAEIFGKDNFYLEIQNHGMEEESVVRDGMARLSKELGLPLVATNDVHYIEKEDSILQDVLTCIQTGKRIDDEDRLKFFGQEFYLKSPSEMEEVFATFPEALSNTEEIAKRCNVSLDFDSIHLPRIELDTELSHFEYLKKLCCEGAEKKYGRIDEKIKSRLDYELDVIEKMGYTDYFLIVWDFIKYAKDNKIPVGPGRGSAAGSIVSYTLNITEVDPIKYDLLFERFLNPERISMPDIDIDICNERRDEVKDYVSRKYGENRVAGIVTFGTMAARAAIRDVGRVLGTTPAVVDKVAKSVPEILHIKLKDALLKEPKLNEMYNTNPEVKKLLDIAMRLEGFVRHASTHAAGVVITDDELFSYVPVQNGDKGLLTQYPMGSLEKIGLLKMDFLGLRNLTIIDNTIKLVKEKKGIEIDVSNMDYEDAETFKLIGKGDTDGVFQLENPGLKAFLRKFRPNKLEDIIATTSIYRPGPMEQIPKFLKNLRNPEKTTYPHPLLEPILKPTYGTIIYQEQVMSIVRTLAGYSLGRADLVRRAMAKKKADEMARERKVFIEGLSDESGKVIIPGTRRNGIDDETANEVFDTLMDFANYAFNKSHAACYARVAYQTAYLKANYPTEYLASLLVSLLGNSHKIVKYINSFSKYGIKLLPPDVNKSTGFFDVEGKNVRFGLSALKNVGINFPKSIVKEREKNGVFKSFEDFVTRMAGSEMNKRSIEVLIKAGAFDSIFPNRRVLLLNFEPMIDIVQKDALGKAADQVSFFASEEMPPSLKPLLPDSAEDFSFLEKLSFENELAGMYLSGHPLNEYLLAAVSFSDADIYSVNDNRVEDGTKVNICGVISGISVKRTKRGLLICTMSFADLYDSIELTAFENTYTKFSELFTEGNALCVTAQVKKHNDDISLMLLDAFEAEKHKLPEKYTLYIKVTDSSEMAEAKKVLDFEKGSTPVCIYLEESDTAFKSDSSHGVKMSTQLVRKLSDLLGADNVKIR